MRVTTEAPRHRETANSGRSISAAHHRRLQRNLLFSGRVAPEQLKTVPLDATDDSEGKTSLRLCGWKLAMPINAQRADRCRTPKGSGTLGRKVPEQRFAQVRHRGKG